jgi:hypothetical protein
MIRLYVGELINDMDMESILVGVFLHLEQAKLVTRKSRVLDHHVGMNIYGFGLNRPLQNLATEKQPIVYREFFDSRDNTDENTEQKPAGQI